MHVYISSLSEYIGKDVLLKGWLYNQRGNNNIRFWEIRDGTGICQCIALRKNLEESLWIMVKKLKQESSVQVFGKIILDDQENNKIELHIKEISIIQHADNYPISHKEHGTDFLLENRHLWLRSKRPWAIMRIRNQTIMAIHSFLQERGFIYAETPILSENATEGTTTLFNVPYFGQTVYLAQSGQLYAEALAMAHGLVYTLGPTFRAEKSKTRRHLTEFWMLEPEMAFYDLPMNMQLAEDLLKHIIHRVTQQCLRELAILKRDISLLTPSLQNTFPRLSYTQALSQLKDSNITHYLDKLEFQQKTIINNAQFEIKELKKEIETPIKKHKKTALEKKIKFYIKELEQSEEYLRNIPNWKSSIKKLKWGDDFGGSDETILSMQYQTPIIIHGYPTSIKAFYMKKDSQNSKTVLAMDILAPEGYGEIIGGSQREENEKELEKRIQEHHLDKDSFQWYLDLRKFGTVPHSGFGLGIERTIAWICGIKHLRECIPFPRTIERIRP